MPFHFHSFSHPHGSNAAATEELWDPASWGIEKHQDPFEGQVEPGSRPVAMMGWTG